MSDYEELRRVATGRPPGAGRGAGLALFLRQGMAAWIEACGVVPSPAGPPRLPPVAPDRRLPIDVRGDVTLVLAAMALSVAVEGGLTA